MGMAALLAAFCSVPLTSVLLLFELTKDYHILLPLMVNLSPFSSEIQILNTSIMGIWSLLSSALMFCDS